MASPNVETLKHAYHLWDKSKGGSVDHWMSIIAEQVDFRSIVDGMPQIPFGKRSMDKVGVRQYLSGLTAGWEMIYYRVDKYIEQGDDIAVVGATSWRNRASGKVATTPLVCLWTFKNGQATGFFEFVDTHQIAQCTDCG